MGTNDPVINITAAPEPLAYLLAVFVASFIIFRFRKAGYEKSGLAYPVLLASFPVYYWVFALYAVDYQALVNELVVGAAFLAIAWLAYRVNDIRSLFILAIGFIGHGAYDIVHLAVLANSVAPLWWPEFCGSIDIILGVYMLWLARLKRQCAHN
jgi:hypothetical protein